MKFAVISDLHYVSKKIMPENPDRNMLLHRYAAETALQMASKQDGIDTILLTGDLTEYGDLDSHSEFIELLRSIKAKGKKVYALTATHDFSLGKSYVRKLGGENIYKSNPWNDEYFDPETADFKKLLKDEFKNLSESEYTPELFPAATRGELWDLYREFGRDDAVSVCDEGSSYCVELDGETWCLMLNDDYRNPDKCGVSSNYPTACYKWINETVKKAKEQGKFIFACTHHPLVPPVPAYKIGGGDMNMRGAFIGHRLADMGFNLVFSGHTHFCDIGYMCSDNGNGLYNITTPGIKNYPPQFRTVEIDGLNSHIKTESVEIEAVKDIDLDGKTLKQYLRDDFIRGYKNKISRIKKPLNKIVAGLKVKHLYPLCRYTAKLTKAEYKSIKNEHIFDIIMELVLNMLGGDGKFTPDTPIYKFMMGLSAVLDSIIDAQPFVDIKRKNLKGYSISDIIEPMLFNNFIPDVNAEFDFSQKPKARFNTHKFKSYAGEILMTILCILAIPLAILSPIVTIVVLPILAIKKKQNTKKNPTQPEKY